MDVNETLLPGVGLRYEFDNSDGDRVGVIAHRRGDFEVFVYTSEDPDTARRVFRLTEREAEALAQILGAPRMVESYADLTKEIPGLDAGQVEVGTGSPYCGRPLGDTRARTRTGASIVAILRGQDVISNPGPDDWLMAGDAVAVLGTPEQRGQFRERLCAAPAGSPDHPGPAPHALS